MTPNPSFKHLVLFAAIAASPVAQAQWAPVEGKMLTRWGEKLDPEAVWQEYPRPQLKRQQWTNLNGAWSYAVTSRDAETPGQWDGSILVPFAPEAALSGVGRLLEPDQALWYERTIPAPTAEGKRTLLHFEAVDYETTVWINDQEVGSHTGGHTPFSFDITPHLRGDDNRLRVRVFDATGDYQLLGKQKLDPGGIWYTRVSGIWQTVWTEEVSPRFIRDLDFESDIRRGRLRIEPKLSGQAMDGEKVRITASIDGSEVTSAVGRPVVVLEIPEPRLWSPDSPDLYELKVELLDADDQVIDEVASYAAMREFGKKRDENGHLRFTLNGEFIFHWGPLDQGWWPDGLLTPPSDEAMLYDIQFLKDAGFNMIRKHIKVEPRRYYYHCDRLGMLMWQDQVSMGYGPHTEPAGSNPRWSRMAPNPQDGTWPDAAHEQYVLEYKRMVDHLRDHPCIAVWVPFNEAWGQHRTMEVGRMAAEYDTTRPINIASGGNFWPVGDIADEHAYPDPAFPVEDVRFEDYVKVVGEFGGHGLPVEGHLWKKDNRNWGYGGLPKDLDEWKERYARSIVILSNLRKRGVAGGVYTQTTDVEVEINGLLTYDRVPKLETEWLKHQSQLLLDTPDNVRWETLVPTSESDATRWRYTFDPPGDDWAAPDFKDDGWDVGDGGFGTRETPNTHVRTEWNTKDIWIRREFTLDAAPEGRPVLRIYHDEDAEVFVNGKLVAELAGYVSRYAQIPIEAEGILKPGRNVVAIHCHQTEGGQFIDAGIIDEISME